MRDQPAASRPHWLCPELQIYILQTCQEYCALEDQAVKKGAWFEQERDNNVDLKLEMLYTRLRSNINQVKYGRIENLRNRRELEIFNSWLENNKEKLKPSTAEDMLRLLRTGEEKCREVETGMEKLVTFLSSGERDRARQVAESVEALRASKRNNLREILSTIMQAWRGQKGLDNISFTS